MINVGIRIDFYKSPFCTNILAPFPGRVLNIDCLFELNFIDVKDLIIENKR